MKTKSKKRELIAPRGDKRYILRDAKGRIDEQAHVWYGMMRIPFAAIDSRPPEKGRELRIGLFRISGAHPRQRHTWRATDGTTFHVPKAFATLRLR